MPSPIAHIAAGYLVARFASGWVRRGSETENKVLFVGFAVGMSILPDLDFVPDLLLGDLGRFHNNFSHSLLFALMAALTIGGLAAAAGRWRFGVAFGLALACYGLHVVMDYFTIGRGVMLFWPLTPERFSAPVPLFYGVRWTDGLLSYRHLWTILTEAPFVVALLVAFNRRHRAAAMSRD